MPALATRLPEFCRCVENARPRPFRSSPVINSARFAARGWPVSDGVALYGDVTERFARSRHERIAERFTLARGANAVWDGIFARRSLLVGALAEMRGLREPRSFASR